MELYQLRSFAAVAELGHLTRAAERLHVSQPALSAQIKSLEDELGVALFSRGPSGMTLTAAGRGLLPEARLVVTAAQALRSHARAIQGEISGRARLGTVSDPEYIRLGDFMAQALAAHPLLDLEVHHEVSGVAFEKVRDGELDAAFYFGNLTHPTIASLPLATLAYRVVAPAAWREQIAVASWEDIAALPWVMTPPISTHHVLAGELFREQGISPIHRVQADHEAVISSLVVAGLGVALMREDLAIEAAAAGDVVLWRDVRLETTLQFIHLDERRDDPMLNALRNVLHIVWPPSPARNVAR